MTTLLEPKVTLEYLAYLGYPHSSSWSSFASSHPPSPSAVASSASRTSYPFSSSTPSSGAGPSSSSAGQGSSSSSSGAHDSASYQLLPTTSALQVTKPRRPSRRKGVPVERNVFLAYVLGAAGSGKTSLLRAFVGKGFEEEDGLAAAAAVGGAARAGGRVSGGGEWAEARGVARGTAAATSSGRGKGKSVVNCVEEGGGERYLVVSGLRLADSQLPRIADSRAPPVRLPVAVARVWLDVRVGGVAEQEEARARGRARVCVRLERHEQFQLRVELAGMFASPVLAFHRWPGTRPDPT